MAQKRPVVPTAVWTERTASYILFAVALAAAAGWYLHLIPDGISRLIFVGAILIASFLFILPFKVLAFRLKLLIVSIIAILLIGWVWGLRIQIVSLGTPEPSSTASPLS